MAEAAISIPGPAKRPEPALRRLLERLADASDPIVNTADTGETLPILVAETVDATVLARTFVLEAAGVPVLRFAVSNRRLVGLTRPADASPEALPSGPSAEIAEYVVGLLRDLASVNHSLTLRPAGRDKGGREFGGSCSARALRSAAQKGGDDMTRIGAGVARASIRGCTRDDPGLRAGEPAHLDLLDRLADAYLPEVLPGSALAPAVVKPRAISVPLPDGLTGLILCEGAACHLMMLDRTDEARVLAQWWARVADGAESG